MKVFVESDRFGHYIVWMVGDERRSLYYQRDWNYPALANNLGWDIRTAPGTGADPDVPAIPAYSAREDVYGPPRPPCAHEGTDGTVDCADCGADTMSFISSAQAWLDAHEGETIDVCAFDDGDWECEDCRESGPHKADCPGFEPRAIINRIREFLPKMAPYRGAGPRTNGVRRIAQYRIGRGKRTGAYRGPDGPVRYARYLESGPGRFGAERYAWPGGYPILYFDRCGDALCADCAGRARFLSAVRDGKAARLTGDIYYEGPPVDCAECGRTVASAYGDPDEKVDGTADAER